MTPLSSEEAFSWGPSALTTAPSTLGCPLCVHPASQTHRRFLKEDLALRVPGTPMSSTPAHLHSRCLISAKMHGPRYIVLSALCTCRSIQEPLSVSASPVGGQDRPGWSRRGSALKTDRPQLTLQLGPSVAGGPWLASFDFFIYKMGRHCGLSGVRVRNSWIPRVKRIAHSIQLLKVRGPQWLRDLDTVHGGGMPSPPTLTWVGREHDAHPKALPSLAFSDGNPT